MSNTEMKPNRYGRWAKYRQICNHIQTALRSGKRVTVGTYLKATTYDLRHIGMFSATRTGCWVQSGKKHLDISGCAIIVTD